MGDGRDCCCCVVCCWAVSFDLGAVGSEGSKVPDSVHGFLHGFYHAFSALFKKILHGFLRGFYYVVCSGGRKERPGGTEEIKPKTDKKCRAVSGGRRTLIKKVRNSPVMVHKRALYQARLKNEPAKHSSYSQ
jgi:hypothetical protein